MEGGALLVATLLLFLAGSVWSQDVVDNDNCEEHNVHCPKDGEPSYKKYCCLESNGGLTLYSCCNPYFGLIIGVSVGIPIIILIIVAVVVAYCVCHHYHNRKMRSLMATYRRRRQEEDRRREARLLAPPPYSTLEEDGTEHTELPVYSEADPYESVSRAELTSRVEDREGGDSNEEGHPPHLETTASVEMEESGESGESGEGGSLSTEQSSCDQAPLLDEGH